MNLPIHDIGFPQRTCLAICPQSNLLAAILAKEPLITECVTLDAWTDKDSSFLAGSIQSVLSNHQHRLAQRSSVVYFLQLAYRSYIE